MNRVLMTADTVGGVWTYALELSRSLAGLGVDTVLATMGRPPSREQRTAARSVPNLELFDSRYRLEWMDDPWDDVEAAGAWLLEIEEHTAPDVVHLNGYAHGALPWQAPHLVVGHSCVLSWWRAVLGEDAPDRYGRYRDAVRDGLRGARAVVAPTRAMLAALETHYGPLPDPRVIPNGVRLGRWRAAAAEPRVLAAGRIWDRAKNLSLLAEVAPRLAWPVHVAGDAEAPDGERVSLEGVDLLGRLAPGELADWMARSALFAHPARYEPFGLAPLEAAASGCALVLGDIDTLREVWGGAALYVDPTSAEALRAGLDRLILDSPLRRTLSDRAQHRALRYDAGTRARAYHALYTGLIARAEAPARAV